MRGVFSTGLLDGLLAKQFNPFDLYLGVSAGAGNLAAYLAEMPGRNLKIYTDYSLQPEFIRFTRFLRGGHLMDLDWLWRMTISEIRLDLPTIYAKGKPFLVGLADVTTGQAVYQLTNADNLEQVLKASSALPVLYRGFPLVDGRPMADGGLVDGLPVQEVIRRGARRIMVIRSRPRSYVKKESLLERLVNWKLQKLPQLKAAMATRIDNYNRTVRLLRQPPPGVTIIELCPPDTFRSTRLSQNPAVLMEGYRQGKALADEAVRRWHEA
ncbi:MAG: patatin family protein [Deltaproteobacteria bacterium]|nr:patatin family protein [Candidatus Anaeroferrophillus wilburensis]MBN2888962.1 patatin family protein [Deltaproteobacteria bacterium]